MSRRKTWLPWAVLGGGALLLLLPLLFFRTAPSEVVDPVRVKPSQPPTPAASEGAVPPAPAVPRRAGHIRIRVVDPDHRPIAGAQVLVLASRAPLAPSKPDVFEPALPEYLTTMSSGGVSGDDVTSDDGRALISVDLSQPAEAMAQLQIMARAEGYVARVPGSIKIVRVPPAGRSVDVQLVLRSGRRIAGQFVNLLSPHDRSSLSFTLSLTGADGEEQWYTYPKISEDGRFEVPSAPNEDLVVRVKHYKGKYEPYTAPVPRGLSHLSIPLAAVKGFVSEPRLVVHVRPPAGLEQLDHHVVFLSADTGAMVKRLSNTRDFERRATRLPPGSYVVWLVAADPKETAGYWARESVVLSPESEMEVTLTLQKGHALRFRLVDAATGKAPASENIIVHVHAPVGSNPAAPLAEFLYRPHLPAMHVGGVQPGVGFVRITDPSGVYEDLEVRSKSADPKGEPQTLSLRRKGG